MDILDDGLDAIEKLIKDETKVSHFGYGYRMIKPDGTEYVVDPIQNTCTCPSGRVCKHLKASKLLTELFT